MNQALLHGFFNINSFIYSYSDLAYLPALIKIFLQIKKEMKAPIESAAQSNKSKLRPGTKYFWMNSIANPQTLKAKAIFKKWDQDQTLAFFQIARTDSVLLGILNTIKANVTAMISAWEIRQDLSGWDRASLKVAIFIFWKIVRLNYSHC